MSTTAEYHRKYRRTPQYQNWLKEYQTRPEVIKRKRVAALKYAENNRESLRLKAAERHKDNREHRLLQSRAAYEQYPERWAAQLKVRRALKAGVLVREPCSCGDRNSHGHHTDYTKPLVVIWLCRSCHQKLHNKLDEEKI